MEYLNLEKIDDEIAQRKSIENFLLVSIYPRLPREKRKIIDYHLNRHGNSGLSVTAAFQFAGVDINCIR